MSWAGTGECRTLNVQHRKQKGRRANREIDKLLHGGQRTEVVRVVDWDEPENNEFLLVSQFWISGELQ